MKNDILTRLRNTCCVVHGGIVHQIGGCTPCEAADEIERLRVLATRLAEEGRCRNCTDYPAIWHKDCAWHTWEQVVRGE